MNRLFEPDMAIRACSSKFKQRITDGVIKTIFRLLLANQFLLHKKTCYKAGFFMQ